MSDTAPTPGSNDFDAADSPARRDALWQVVLQARAELWAPRSKAPDIARRLILDGMLPERAVAAADLLAE